MTVKRKYGWRRDLPDVRDFKYKIVEEIGLPTEVDLRKPVYPIVDQGSLGSCHDDQTEVLTDSGWKLFSYVDIESDLLATVCPETKKLIFEKPIRLVKLDYDGDIYYAVHKSLNFAVTGDHKLLVRKWNENKRTLNSNYDFVNAKDLGWYSGLMTFIDYDGRIPSDYYTFEPISHNVIAKRNGMKIPMNIWLRFVGIYLAEGTMISLKKEYRIQLAAYKTREKEFIRKLLNDMNINYTEYIDRFIFSNKQIFTELVNYRLLHVKAPHKFVPRFIFDQSSDNIKEFLNGFFAGDGYLIASNRAFSTSSKQLSDDIQLLVFLSGKWSTIYSKPSRVSVIKGRKINSTHPEYCVIEWNKANLSIDKKAQFDSSKYKGKVYCAEVPTYHTLVTRREGKLLISGNCVGCGVANVDFAVQHIQKKESPFYPSRLFIYYNARAYIGTTWYDSGATIRDGIKSIAKLGVCDEASWTYNTLKYRLKPSSSCYVKAEQNQAIKYESVSQDLYSLKHVLASGFPVVGGIVLYDSFKSDRVEQTGIAGMPNPSKEKQLGGHCISIYGYSDKHQWFICMNSWGTAWGDKGWFYLPYDYLINKGLAADFWVVKLVE